LKIGIVGAGSIGGWLGAKLAAGGHEVSVLARGATLAAIAANGLILREGDRETRQAVASSADPAALGPQDALILAVKSQSLPALAPTLAPMIGPATLVLPMLNGVPWWFMGAGEPLRSVDPAGAIGAAIPYDQILGCVVHGSAACPEPGVTALRFADKVFIGEPAGGLSERARAIVSVLVDAGVPAVATDKIKFEIWYKLWGNMTMNPISALTLATADRVLDDPLVNGFVLAVMAEAKAVGAKIGCPIEQTGEDRNAVTRKLGAFKTSMLQDVEAGRAIELDALLAAPREIAVRAGVPTPNIDALFGLARLMGASRGIY